MTTTLFLELLFTFSIITGLITEVYKKIANDKIHYSYNIIALIIAIIVGVIGSFIYYQLNNISITINNIIYAFLLGGASGLCSMLGFDKVKQTIEQIVNK